MATRYVPAPFGGLQISTTEIGVSSVHFLPTCPNNPPADRDSLADRAATQVAEYLAGDRTEFDLSLDWGGIVSFRRHVLDVLYETVGYGVTVTYQELADRAGQPSAARVVGQVMGSNPLPVVVPCHRVTASGGELGGFGGGLETKRWLLELEGSLPPRLPF